MNDTNTLATPHENTSPSRGSSLLTWVMMGIVGLIGVVLRLAWARLLPYNDAPDEYCHWPMVAYLATHAVPPTMADVPERIPVSYPALCPLGYVVPAIGAAWVGPEQENAYLAARSLQALLAIPFLGLVFAATRAWVGRQSVVPLLVTALAALHPELVFVFAYVNNDATMLTFAAALWWLAGRCGTLGITPRRCAWLGVLLALAILAKTNAVGLGLIGPPLLLLAFLESRSLGLSSAIAGTAGLLLTLLPWSCWSLWHHGSLLGFQTHARWWRQHIENNHIPQGFLQLEQVGSFFNDAWESSWACFGYTSVRLEPWVYTTMTLVTGLGLGAGWAMRSREARVARGILILGAGWLGVWIAHGFHSATVGLTSQGRYVLPSAWPMLLAISLGILRLTPRPCGKVILAGVLVLLAGGLQYLSYQAEERSNRIAQPDRRVRARLIAYAGDLPGQRESPPIEYLPSDLIEPTVRGGKTLLRVKGDGALEWPTEVPASRVGAIVIDQHWIGGTLPHGRLRVLSADGAGVPLGEIPSSDPIIGRIRLRFDLRRLLEPLGEQRIRIEYRPSPAPCEIDLPHWELLDREFRPIRTEELLPN